MKLAVIQVASYGDVVISSCLVKAIKEKHPDWNITFITSSACSGAMLGNIYINSLMAVPATKDQAWAMQDRIIANAKSKYDKVITPWAGFLPQEQWRLHRNPETETYRPAATNFMWCYARAAEELGIEMKGPLKLDLFTSQEEKDKIFRFVGQLAERPVLLETDGHSSQSWMNLSWLSSICGTIRKKWPHKPILVSRGGDEPQEVAAAKWLHGGVTLLNNFSLREVSELARHCDVFVGCSSGTSNVIHAVQTVRPKLWVENVRSTIWDSSPLSLDGKTISTTPDCAEFCEVLRSRL